MAELLPTILIGVISLGIGYLISRYQNRQLIRTATKILRPFEAVSLRDEFHMAHILASLIRAESPLPDLIVAITPGGSMIGEWLSRRLLGSKTSPRRMCSLWMDVERDAEGRHLSLPKACGFPTAPLSEAKKILIVNDISRTGRTLGEAVEFSKRTYPGAMIKTAVLFLSQDAGPPYPDFWVDKPSRRVVFEWKERGT